MEPVSCRLAQILKGHVRCRKERWTLSSDSSHFLFLLLFDRCTCPFVPWMKRILPMLPPLACPLFHCLTTSSPFLFFIFVAHAYSECLLTLLPLDKSPGRRYQPPAHGQEPAGSHWGSCQFLLALHLYCLLLGGSWPEHNSQHCARHPETQ